MIIRRRTLLSATAATAAAAIASPAHAQNYPRRAVQLVVAFPAGGSTDVVWVARTNENDAHAKVLAQVRQECNLCGSVFPCLRSKNFKLCKSRLIFDS